MGGPRSEIFHWIEQGRLRHGGLAEALQLTGVTPGARDWKRFFDQLTLWLGTVFCAAAVIFFFAYNWQAMGRYAKFGLVEMLIVTSLVFCWRLDLEKLAGKAVLLMATLLTGALLALVGQTYQTGADTYELFAVWALAVLPWIVVGRFGVLWLVWLALLNLATIFYFQTFGGFFGWIFSTERKLWTLFALNTAALLVWEGAAQMGLAWLRERWSVRVVATASGGLITTLMIWAVLDHHGSGRLYAVLAYCVWMAVAYVYYRHRLADVFVLAGGVLSAIMVMTVILVRIMDRMEAGAFLLIGMLIIGMSAAGGLWLKNVANEERT
ncbi:MAG: DUF2157 domain-containing protein [Proteobacteria bacterium]|nr:DUF2157 domain-containing protein [Pseudomonadota bacterium]